MTERGGIGTKPRIAGTAAAAAAEAWAQAGGVKAVSAETGIKERRLYGAADPDSDGGDHKELTWREVMRLERDLGITAFSDALVALRGGVVLDGADGRDVASLRLMFVAASQAATLALMEDRREAAALELEKSLRLGAALRAALMERAR